jgi:hypothetical protein
VCFAVLVCTKCWLFQTIVLIEIESFSIPINVFALRLRDKNDQLTPWLEARTCSGLLFYITLTPLYYLPSYIDGCGHFATNVKISFC